MVKPTHTEAIRRGFVIIGMMGPTAITSRDIHSKLINQEGFDVSLRTVERDLAELPNIFPQYFTVIDRTKPWGYKLPLNAKKTSGMSPAEAVCLQLAFDYLNPLLPNKSLDPMTPYLKEAEAVLNMISANKMKNWKKKVLTLNEGFQLTQAKVSSEILSNIHQALWDGKMIKVKYTSKYKKDSSSYELNPGGLVYRGRISYLICSFDNDRDKPIYLPLHRFEEVTVGEKPSALEGKDVKNLVKGLLGFQVAKEKIKIKLKFSQMAGGHLYETPISSSQKIKLSKEGYIIVEDKVEDDMELRFWIQGFADRVEVLGPKKLREEFKLSSKRLRNMYEKD
jgi:predicted DNA-binding transcriptional regulator YafY